MVSKYVRKLEQRQLNPSTGETWAIQDVPTPWQAQTRSKVEADGYYFDEDGTAHKNEPNE